MYVKITNGSVDTYPYSVGELRRANPNVTFPKKIPDALLAEYGVYLVTETDQPSYTPRTQNIAQETTPILVGDAWTVDWTITDKTTEEIAEYDADTATTNRATRDAKLAETDFYALSDVTMSSEMQSYRQSLRDITTHENWPNLEDADWPTAP